MLCFTKSKFNDNWSLAQNNSLDINEDDGDVDAVLRFLFKRAVCMTCMKTMLVGWTVNDPIITGFLCPFPAAVGACGTPVTIPASPFMKKLGCGTGVSVYLMNRYDRLKSVIWLDDGLMEALSILDCLKIAFRNGKQTQSPWAIKKINSKCANSQMNVYQERLFEEAKILKELQHPNIVGKNVFASVGLLGIRVLRGMFPLGSHSFFNPAVAPCLGCAGKTSLPNDLKGYNR